MSTATTGKLYSCDTKGDNTTCSSLAASDETPKTDDGYGYIDGTTPANIIQCTKTGSNVTCESIAGPSTNDKGFGLIDATDNAEEGKAPANQYFINFAKKSMIIVCSATDGCSTIEGNSATTGNKYYPDGEDKSKIFLCEPKASDTAVEYKYVLECDTTNGCVSSLNLATENQPSYYVDSSDTAKPLIITCTPDKCTSGEGSTAEGTAYRDATDAKNVITCTSAKCNTPAAGAGTVDTYIDAGNLSQIINCKTDVCNYIKADAIALIQILSTFINWCKGIIECDYDNSSKNVTCKLDKETAVKPNSVYINGLFGKPKGDEENPLIICDATKCTPSKAKITGTSKSYYINSDIQSVNKTLKNDIIECTKESEECTLSNGSNTNVYLNANFNAESNQNQLIICRTNGGCSEQKANSTTTDLHYLSTLVVQLKQH
ncbi:hypothetical protein BCR36DRAFT_375795 [Piromyces finnis]|uniref:Scaffoldin n=1 Tax=Piromyces finnis TaxID=1754191 RepID=A0A1Y1UCR8_9FUNG|nr:hypothetical protein BCR36DRAFT_375795 [Piromyces finnis]|eukprot:ORX35840.1 hypothetical protein BCR36DRAFT_375795 [Piromyces finnis]